MFRQRLVIPAYFYPNWNGGSDWEKLIAVGREPIAAAVMNPSSGPGTAVVGDYSGVVNRALLAGIPIVGYVDTNYGARTTADVEADIDKYYSWYGVRGIFFDRVASDTAHLAYYTTLCNYVRTKPGGGKTILNHGTVPADQGYLSICDVDVLFEGSWATYQTTTFPAWTLTIRPDKVCHIVYATGTGIADQLAACELAALRGAASVYATQLPLAPNPYNALPVYFADLTTYPGA